MKAQRNDSDLAVTDTSQGHRTQGSQAGTSSKNVPQPQSDDQISLFEKTGKLYYRTRWVAWLIIAIGWSVSLAAVLTKGGAVEMYMLIVLSFLPIISIVLPVLSVIGLSISRTIQVQQVKDGGKADVQLTIKRSAAMPFAWLAVHDGMENTSSKEKTRLDYRYIVMPLFQKEVQINYSMLAVRRGEHQFDQVTVTVGDWLGLTAIHRKLACPGVLLALPALPEEIGKRTGRLHGAIAEQISGDSSSAYISDSGEISESVVDKLIQQSGIGPDSRPYREGDSLRHINWRAAAKGRGMFTKQHMLEQPAEVIVIADTFGAAYSQDGRLFDACLGWTARAIERAASEGSEVRLITATAGAAKQSKKDNEAKAKSSRKENARRGSLSQQTKAHLERLAKLTLTSTAVTAENLRSELGGLKPGGMIHVFTADWKNGQSWTQLAAYAAEQGCRLELHLVTKQLVLTYAMREQQRQLEQAGIVLNWLAYPEQMNQQPQVVEGGGK